MSNLFEPSFGAIKAMKDLHDATAPGREAIQRLRDASGFIPADMPDNEATQRLIAEATQAVDWLQDAFKQTAEWRREKAAEHPDDTRNAEAAILLDRLAATVEDTLLPTLLRYHELFSDDDPSVLERQNDLLKEIGFHRWPKDAEDFLTEFLATVS